MAETKKATTAKTTATKKAPAKKAAPQKAAAAKADTAPQTVLIDGQEFNLNSLSDDAKAQLNNLRATDRLIEELELELAIARTARVTYGEELKRALGDTKAPASGTKTLQ